MDDLSSKFVVVAFRDEKQAYEGVRALSDLHGEATISLYGYAVIQRGVDGSVSMKTAQLEGPIGTGVGALVGALMGIYANPVGSGVGMSIVTAVGASRDLFSLGVGCEFIASVGKQLPQGSTALVAEISEDWLAPLDSRMEAIGGTVLREWRDDYVDVEMQKRIDQARVEFLQRRAGLAAVTAEKKDALKNEVSKVEQNLRCALDRIENRLDRFGREAEAKVQALNEQAKKAGTESKARIEQRIAAIRADHAQRKARLERSGQLALEALQP